MRHLLAIAVLVALPVALSAQQRDSARVLEVRPFLKDPDLAPVLAIAVSGGGQIYAGRAREGWTRFAVTVAGAALAGYGSSAKCLEGHSTRSCDGYQMWGAGVAFVSWISGIITAREDVLEYNRRVRGQR